MPILWIVISTRSIPSHLRPISIWKQRLVSVAKPSQQKSRCLKKTAFPEWESEQLAQVRSEIITDVVARWCHHPRLSWARRWTFRGALTPESRRAGGRTPGCDVLLLVRSGSAGRWEQTPTGQMALSPRYRWLNVGSDTPSHLPSVTEKRVWLPAVVWCLSYGRPSVFVSFLPIIWASFPPSLKRHKTETFLPNEVMVWNVHVRAKSVHLLEENRPGSPVKQSHKEILELKCVTAEKRNRSWRVALVWATLS